MVDPTQCMATMAARAYHTTVCSCSQAQEFIPQPTIPTVSGLNMVINLSDYSTFNRLLAVTAYTYRYVSNLNKSRPKLGRPQNSIQLRVQAHQELVYSKELASVKSNCDHPAGKRPPLVRQLQLFVDDKGLLQCWGTDSQCST